MSQGIAFIRRGKKYAQLHQTLGVIARNTGYATPQALTEAMLTRVATLCVEGMGEMAACDQAVAEVVSKFNANFKARIEAHNVE